MVMIGASFIFRSLMNSVAKFMFFFFFFSVLRKQIAERCVLVRLEYLYVDGL